MQNGLQLLKQLINHVHPLSDSEWNLFAGIWQPFEAGRKEVLTAPGETEKYLYVVLSGVQRVYYYDHAEHEATLVFTYAPSFGGVLDSLLQKKPSLYFYETLTPSTFLKATADDLHQLIETQPGIALLINKGLTEALAGVLQRLVELQCFSSEEKFRELLKRSPHILQLIPHKYLAN